MKATKDNQPILFGCCFKTHPALGRAILFYIFPHIRIPTQMKSTFAPPSMKSVIKKLNTDTNTFVHNWRTIKGNRNNATKAQFKHYKNNRPCFRRSFPNTFWAKRKSFVLYFSMHWNCNTTRKSNIVPFHYPELHEHLYLALAFALPLPFALAFALGMASH